jgi:hypothetical protein
MRLRKPKLLTLYEPYEFSALANYNAEVARGIMHTQAWVEKMRLEQERFNAQQRERAEREGAVIV